MNNDNNNAIKSIDFDLIANEINKIEKYKNDLQNAVSMLCYYRSIPDESIPTTTITSTSSSSSLSSVTALDSSSISLLKEPEIKMPMIIERKQKLKRKTKIICAIGPSCNSVEMIGKLLDAGMNIARLNFSHGTHEYHLKSLNAIRDAVKERILRGEDCHCAILMDTKGPEIRTGFLIDHKPVEVIVGSIVEVSTDYTKLGDATHLTCSYSELAESVKPGDKILIADGELTLRVTSCDIANGKVLTIAENTQTIEEQKNMNLPGVTINLPGISEKDLDDIINFGVKHNVDIISGSFVRTAANVRALRSCLGEGSKIRVHAKIESVTALQNIAEILSEADGIHVSRGDLGMELSLAKLTLAQKAAIRLANIAGKPVVTSTQLLESMVKKPRPLNSECTDVANAVLDGADCLMLSSETAKGSYPIESVETMVRIITEAESCIDYDRSYSDLNEEIHRFMVDKHLIYHPFEVIASTAVETSINLLAPLIVVVSATGRMAVYVAKYRPKARILVLTTNPTVARQMSISRGVDAILYENEDLLQIGDDLPDHIEKHILKLRLVKSGDRIILIDGIDRLSIQSNNDSFDQDITKNNMNDVLPTSFVRGVRVLTMP